MAERSKQTISAISIIPLVLGSILMLAAGFGLLSKNAVFAGLVCFMVFAFIEGISRKKIGVKSDGNHTRTQNTNRRNYQRQGMPKGFQMLQIRIRGPLQVKDFSRW